MGYRWIVGIIGAALLTGCLPSGKPPKEPKAFFRVERPIHLFPIDKNLDKRVYLTYQDYSDEQVPLQETLEDAFIKEGYLVVDDPKEAVFTVTVRLLASDIRYADAEGIEALRENGRFLQHRYDFQLFIVQRLEEGETRLTEAHAAESSFALEPSVPATPGPEDKDETPPSGKDASDASPDRASPERTGGFASSLEIRSFKKYPYFTHIESVKASYTALYPDKMSAKERKNAKEQTVRAIARQVAGLFAL